MRVAALVESVDHVCVRYRLAPYTAAFDAFDLIPFEKSLLGRLRQYRSMAEYDAVVLQRTLLSKFELTMLRRHTKKLIFDFDDAIWLRDSYARNGYSRKRQRRFKNVVNAADVIFAGNEFLAEHCGPKARVLPTCVDADAYRGARFQRAEPAGTLETNPTISMVWIGSSSTLNSLVSIDSTLTAIGRAFPDIALHIICDREVDFAPLATINHRWALDTEIADIQRCDIGIAVMPDDDWSRGKCGVKVLQYMAAGLPVIANPVGVHKTMVIPNETGFLANSAGEWIAAIEQLQDVKQRERLGANARQLVEKRYSTRVGMKVWATSLRDRLEACPTLRRIAC